MGKVLILAILSFLVVDGTGTAILWYLMQFQVPPIIAAIIGGLAGIGLNRLIRLVFTK